MHNKTIIFDLNGNDNGILAGVEAAKIFCQNHPDYQIILVGNQDEISQIIEPNEQIQIHHSPNQVSKDVANLTTCFKEDNSMNAALNLLKEQKGAAVLSSGDSGKYLMSSLMILKRLPNVNRPAFMSIIPTILANKKFLLLDEGANLHTSSDHLVQWAKLGAIFAKTILNVENPKVGIVNIGTEDYKGYEFHQEANQILKTTQNDFDYLGFVETRKLLEGFCDVAVADGFTGNITLKTLEGTVLAFLKLIKNQLTKTTMRKLATAFLKNAFGEIKEQLDYRNVGAAWILGINGIVIKAHGSSDQKAYLGALNQIKIAIETNALEKLKKILE